MKDVAQEAVKQFGSDHVIVTNGPYIHIDREKPSQDCSRVKKTILDLHFMQHCDRIVISNSNYGKFGMMLRPEPTKDAYIFRDNEFHAVDHNIMF